MTTAAPPQCAVAAYARDVVSGRILAGEFVRLACQRHLDDLVRADGVTLRWNQAEADAVIQFFGYLPQFQGRWALQRLILLPWQAFCVGSVFGWQLWDARLDRWVRRFRESFISVARKQGKTTLAAGIALWLLDFDHEPGAQVFAAACKRDQAKQCWQAAERMVALTPMLSRRIAHLSSSSRLVVRDTASYFAPLGRDSDSEHGLNPHGAIIDELHVHPTRDMVDALTTAIGARSQPLIWYITTAGVEGESIYTETDDRARRVVQGIAPDDRLFVYLATLDDGDEWTDPAVYIKGNPSLGVTIQVEDLIAERDKAMTTPGLQNVFKRLRLNIRTSQETAWLDVNQWDACAVDTLEREGLKVLGVDLGGNADLSAAAVLTMDDEGGLDIALRFWMPRERVSYMEQRDGVPYAAWIQAGWITPTDGDWRDDAAILHDLYELCGERGIHEVMFDPHGFGYIGSQLGGMGLTVARVPQTFGELGPATAHFENQLSRGQVAHLGNPVMRWMVTNVSVDQSREGARKPSRYGAIVYKKHIDGLSAVVTGLARLLRMTTTETVIDGEVLWV